MRNHVIDFVGIQFGYMAQFKLSETKSWNTLCSKLTVVDHFYILKKENDMTETIKSRCVPYHAQQQYNKDANMERRTPYWSQ